MVRASGQIEQDLRALQDKTEVMESALDPLYEGYIKALADAGQRQLMMAAYYLCTQAYPDKFLALSWNDRNRLQQSLQVLSAQIQSQLSQQREETKRMSRRPQSADGLAFLQRLLEARMSRGALEKKADKNDSSEERAASRRQERSTSELFSDDEESFIPSAEEDVDVYGSEDRDGDEHELDKASFDRDDLEARDNADEEVDSDAFDMSVLDMDEETLEALEASRDRDRRADKAAAADTHDAEADDMAFEMEVPAADERLSVDEEEDLLAALEGLARRSMEMRGDASADGNLNAGSEDESEEEQPLQPVHLLKQQMLMERSIREVFKGVSEEANELLQKANVMPSFPRSLLAAATESSGIGEPANAVPNVVRVSVRVMHGETSLDLDDEGEEIEGRRSGRSRELDDELADSESADSDLTDAEGADFEDSDSDRRSRRSGRRESRSRRASRTGKGRDDMRRRLSRSSRSDRRRKSQRKAHMIPHDIVEIDALPELAAIRLRLSEVEFTDPTVSAWRGKLRQKLSELKQLGLRYKKTQRSLEVAQAEDAWRSSWTVHTPDSDQ